MYKRQTPTSNIYILFQHSTNQTGVFQHQKVYELPTSNPYYLPLTEHQNMPKEIIGFQNIGQTCWLNSLMQCLFSIKYIKKIFIDYLLPLESAGQTNTTAYYVGKLFKYKDAQTSMKQLNPTIEKLLDCVSNTIEKPYNNHGTHDPEEFFKDLLNCIIIENSTSKSIQQAINYNDYEQFKRGYFQENDIDLIKETSIFMMRERIYSCGHKKIDYDGRYILTVFTDGQKNDQSITEIIKTLTNIENINEESECSQCQMKVKLTIKHTIKELPKYLFIHIQLSLIHI